MLTAPALTLLFLVIVICLGAAFVWMFWEIEQKNSRIARAIAQDRPITIPSSAVSVRAIPRVCGVRRASPANAEGKKTRPSTQYTVNDLASPGY